jgi:hypothetical protein
MDVFGAITNSDVRSAVGAKLLEAPVLPAEYNLHTPLMKAR